MAQTRAAAGLSLFNSSPRALRAVPSENPYRYWAPSARCAAKAQKQRSLYHASLDHIHFVFAAVLLFITVVVATPPQPHHGVSVDPPRTRIAIPFPGAARDDAMRLSIARDGKAYFGRDRVEFSELTNKIRESVQEGSERRVYINVDSRAKYGEVNEALAAIGDSGVPSVTFLTERLAP